MFIQLKKRIIATFGASPESNLRKLLKGQVIAVGKPSLILNRLRGLNDGKCDDSIIKSVFLDHLPANTRAILAASAIDDLNGLADIADKIADNSVPPEAVVAASTKSHDDSGTRLSELCNEIKKVAIGMESLSTRLHRIQQGHSSRRDRSLSRSNQSRGRSNEHTKQKLCWAHTRYPKNPTFCRKWCSRYNTWKAENQLDPPSRRRAKGSSKIGASSYS